MEVEILQENLLRGLGCVSRFVAVKPTLPVLAMVLIRTNKGKLTLTATDMDTGIEIDVGSRVISEGSLVVPARLLMDYVNSLPPGKVKVSVVGNELIMASGRNKAKITGIDAGEFPEMPSFTSKTKFDIKPEEIRKIVRLVSFAALTDMVRPVLAAILLKIKQKQKMDVVATDGYRLSLLSKVVITGEVENKSILISARVINELERLLKEGEGSEIKVVVDEKGKSIKFTFGDIKLVTRMVEGDFPDYEKILPKEGKVVFKGDRDSILEAVKLASVFARESSNIVRWNVSNDSIVMSSNSTNLGEQESVVEGKLVKGEEGKIAFNSKYLGEFLGCVSDGEIEFSMNDALQPGMFKTKEENFLHVIMPVRVQGE